MEERRSYERISMDDNSGYYDYTIEIDGACFLAMLMDISIGGARLKLNDAPGRSTCGRQGTITNEYYAKPYLAGRSYTVAWQDEHYIGVSFAEPLIGSYKPPCLHESKSS